jgi:hypothetical protein
MRTPVWYVTALLLAGCAMLPAERERLPTGVKLLHSNEGRCSGTMEIEANPALRVDEGEQTVLAVGDEADVEWRCFSSLHSYSGEFACPYGTSHIRISRDKDDDDFLLECYGA